MRIQLITDWDLKQKIYNLRYKIYVEEMQRTQEYADHDNKMIMEPLDEASNLFAAFNNQEEIIGTLRINYASRSSLGFYESLYQMHSVECHHPGATSIATKFMVEKSYRNTSVPLFLALAAYKKSVEDGILFNFIDVNCHLVDFFTKLGYLPRGNIRHPEYGEVTLMRNSLYDQKYLKKIKSPFYRILTKYLESRNKNT